MVNKITYSGLGLSIETQELVRKITDQFGIKNLIPKEKLHVTIFYSRDYIKDYFPLGEVNFEGRFEKFDIFDTQDGRRVLVIELSSDSIIERNEELVSKFNIKSDFDSYRPHITISFRYKGEIPNIEGLDFNLKESVFTFNKEYRKDFNGRP
ncbi:MAG: putative RNA 2',3'-cyclic phosphodiesterase [uncultured marine phage]|uniref:Anti-CBASS protein Acb1 n=1 Tax=uncultured marine phage TaxID=707152 RepID=A0A8D9CCN8_9VIRU|nr:MAG: putative RNA 2',3'-cyclic phosphodiesterase [uncultured marine phage]